MAGPDANELMRLAGELKAKMNHIPGAKNVDDDWGPRIKKFFVRIEQAKLSRSGLTNKDVAVSLNTVLSGSSVGEFREDDNTIPITMRAKGSQNVSYDNIESLNIFAQGSGRNVPLAEVATVIPEWQYSSVLRRNLKRTISVSCQLEEGFTAGDVSNVLDPWIEEQSKSWKRGYTYEYGGEAESSGDAMSAVTAKLPLSFFIILLLLVLQFNSVRRTVIILSTIPLGLIGVVGGLLLTGSHFSFTGFLGVISLAGIVINNAIVLIDRIEVDIRDFGRAPYDAVINAANERFRPILLTTFTTSFGLIPLWIGGGVMWQPMAIGIIFGLLFATVITLIFVPAMYKMLFRIPTPK